MRWEECWAPGIPWCLSGTEQQDTGSTLSAVAWWPGTNERDAGNLQGTCRETLLILQLCIAKSASLVPVKRHPCPRRRLTRAHCSWRSMIWMLPCRWINGHLANLYAPSFHTSRPETLQCPAKALDSRIRASAKSESKTNPYLVILSELKHSNSFSL